MIRSLLYVPAHNPRFLAKAHERGADAIILDLEDAVPENRKDMARAALATAVPHAAQNGASVFVRINAGPRHLADAAAASGAGAFGLVLPKARDPEAIDSLAGTLRGLEAEMGRPATCFLALIESPAGVLDARAIARCHRVVGLITGGEDLATALGGEPAPDVLRFPKLMVHYAAKAEGRMSLGMLRSVADYADAGAVAAAAREARQHGFDGATCIHPTAVEVLNDAFSPTQADIEWAERIVAAADQSDGAFVLDGRMVDAPIIARAMIILERHRPREQPAKG